MRKVKRTKKKHGALVSLVILTIQVSFLLPVSLILIGLAGLVLYRGLRGEPVDIFLLREFLYQHRSGGILYVIFHMTCWALEFIVYLVKYRNIIRWRDLFDFSAVDITGKILIGLMVISYVVQNLATEPEATEIGVVLGMVFCGPLMEELFFRHIWITELRKKTRFKIVAIVTLQTVAWVFLHFPRTFAALLYLVVSGIMFGYIYIYSRSIAYVYIFHGLGNFPTSDYLPVPFILAHSFYFYWGSFIVTILCFALFALHARRRHFPLPPRGEVAVPTAPGEAGDAPLPGGAEGDDVHP